MIKNNFSRIIRVAAAACFLCNAVATAQQPLYPVLSVPRFVDAGSLPSQVSFQITNAGGGTLSWSIGDIAYKQAGGWISAVEPRSGGTQTASTVTLAITREGFARGIYTAILPVFSNGGNAEISVRMEVAPAFVDTKQINLGATLASDSFMIKNYTQSLLVWEAACLDADNQSVPWLLLSPQQGELDANDNQTVIISADRTGLAAGAYSATVEVMIGVNGEQGAERIAVTMTVPDSEVQCPMALALNDAEQSDLAALRSFRDHVLARTETGRACIRWYYRSSRYIFGVIEQRPRLRQAAAIMLRSVLPLLKASAAMAGAETAAAHAP